MPTVLLAMTLSITPIALAPPGSATEQKWTSTEQRDVPVGPTRATYSFSYPEGWTQNTKDGATRVAAQGQPRTGFTVRPVHTGAGGDDALLNEPMGLEKWIQRARPALRAVAMLEAQIMGKKVPVLRLKGEIAKTEVSVLVAVVTVGKVHFVMLSTTPWDGAEADEPVFLKSMASLKATSG